MHLGRIEEVQAGDHDRRLHDGVRRAVEADEGPPCVLRHYAGLEPHAFLRLVAGVDDELPGPTGVHQHAAADRRRRPGGRRLEPADHNPRQEQHVVGDVEHALRMPGQMRCRLAAGEGPQHEPLDAGRQTLALVDPRAHGGDMHAAGGIDAGDESFQDHGLTGGGNGRTTAAMINFGIPAPKRHSVLSVPRPRIHFVTGRLAEHSLRQVLERLAPRAGFDYTVQVMPITVAALMTTAWIARRLQVPEGTARVVLPGGCRGPLQAVCDVCGTPVERGPEDLRCLDEFFGQKSHDLSGYGRHDIEIIAEINHAPTLSRDAILAAARRLRDEGADRIDLGCDPGGGWSGVGDAVRMLVDEGLAVSVDSFDPREVAAATAAGASLVLSVNSSNAAAAAAQSAMPAGDELADGVVVAVPLPEGEPVGVPLPDAVPV